MKKTKELAKDSIFCAIVSTFIILFNILSVFDYMYISTIILIFLGCYFQNKKITRPIVSSLVILAVSFLAVSNPFYVLLIILPSLTMGVVCSLLFKNRIKFGLFFLIGSTLCYGLNILMEFGFVNVILGVRMIDYLLADDIFNISQTLSTLGGVLVVVYLLGIFVISLLQVAITYNINKIYKKRIIPLIGEKI